MGWDDGHPGERPRHRVWVDAFAIARTPVTNAECARWLAATGAAPPPWWTTRASTIRSSPWSASMGRGGAVLRVAVEREGGRHRLPTEAEWEKAARGGLDGARFPWGERRPATAPLRPAAPRQGTRPPTRSGSPTSPASATNGAPTGRTTGYYATSPARNPRGPSRGTRRVSRGGAWRHPDPWSPVAHRSSLPPDLRYSDYGFRVVRVPES